MDRELTDLDLERVAAGADAKGISCGVVRALASACDRQKLSNNAPAPR